MRQNERMASLTVDQQRQIAAVALWRWRAPMLTFGLDEAWGIDPAMLESLFHLMAEAPSPESDQAYRQAVAELRTAQLFAFEVDPDTIELVQFEIIDSLLTFGASLDSPRTAEVERVVETASSLANYVDGLVEGSFRSHPWEQSHRQYLVDLADQVSGHGYLAVRSSVIESACHHALVSLPDGRLLDSATRRELRVLCEDFGEEVVTLLRWLRTTGY